MKTRILLFLMLALTIGLLIPGVLFAQKPVIINNTGYLIEADGGGSAPLTIPNSGQKAINWSLSDPTVATFKLAYFSGGVIKKVGTVNIKVSEENGLQAIKLVGDPNNLSKLSKEVKPPKKTEVKKKKDEVKDEPRSVNERDIYQGYYEPNIAPVVLGICNSSEHTITITDGPAKGISLNPGDTSMYAIEVNLGPFQCPILYDIDSDSTSAGRNFMEGVLSTIIAEGDSMLNIREWDLILDLGEAKKLRFTSAFPDRFVVTGGSFIIENPQDNVIALAPGEYWEGKVKFRYGFNNLSLRYRDSKDGRLKQANLMFIVTRGDREIILNWDQVTDVDILSRLSDIEQSIK